MSLAPCAAMPPLRRMLRSDTEEFFQPPLFVLGALPQPQPAQQPASQPYPEPEQAKPSPLVALEAPIDDLLESLLDQPLDLAPIELVAPPVARVSLPVLRPKNRTECKSVPRPCPFVSCRYNLYLDVRTDGVLRLNFPDREPDEMTASCALDLASDGPRTLDAIAGLMGMSKERARQLEASGLSQVQSRFTPEDVD